MHSKRIELLALVAIVACQPGNELHPQPAAGAPEPSSVVTVAIASTSPAPSPSSPAPSPSSPAPLSPSSDADAENDAQLIAIAKRNEAEYLRLDPDSASRRVPKGSVSLHQLMVQLSTDNDAFARLEGKVISVYGRFAGLNAADGVTTVVRSVAFDDGVHIDCLLADLPSEYPKGTWVTARGTLRGDKWDHRLESCLIFPDWSN